MSKLPTADQINDINKHIDSGFHINAIKMLRDITGMGLPRAKHIIELQTNVPRSTMDRAGVLSAYDGLWEYFKSLHVYDSQIDNLSKLVQSLNERLECVSKELRYAEDQRNAAYSDRDEYKSRLNAMRTTAGLEPLSTRQDAVDQLTSEAQRDGFYRETGLREFGSVQPMPLMDPEISAMSSMVDMLAPMDPEARSRVLDYLQRRFE